ncbi:leucine-rich repeat receptor-like protein kinase [Hibiscus syriacus]|uniref:Leucine-rich repeat receptor-like protein kinase n=1 Tax=Hibiscus syriacus TaxID=106335 RepID=A0A6A3CAM9_HIBSY|nr:uncharacterized protein LOC120202036 [Hibiscus syriacus]XP_039058453.1 uncharacterized protein LOC120202036 [Hibiscus syriacus]XP_039058454.1 uncharacterized protein LOC120202036 [Hibiscus syriacus]KAE8725806.1 leucine-rich repeat receptor-like protein kinase [Hibiscus syriacus]
MKDTGTKRRNSANVQPKHPGRADKRNNKPNQGNGGKILKSKEPESKALRARSDPSSKVSDLNVGSEPTEVYENVIIHYVDDVNKPEETSADPKGNKMATKVKKDEVLDDCSSDVEGETTRGKEEESDSETTKDSISSVGDPSTAEDEREESIPRVSNGVHNNNLTNGSSHDSRIEPNHETYKLHSKALNNTPMKSSKSNGDPPKNATKSPLEKTSKLSPTPFESLEVSTDKHAEELIEVDALDETSNGTQSFAGDNEPVDADDKFQVENEAALNEKIKEMKTRIDKLEAELREVAALEISLYSVVPEHGSSAHKLHTPARRLARLYIHACKHWAQNRRATVAKNTMSGLILIAKSCGNDVSRLTFWLSNTILLRGVISQSFGNSCNSRPFSRHSELIGSNKRGEVKSTTLKWKGGAGSKQLNGFGPLVDDWQETGTFTSALEKLESWLFSRIVESVWWQALTPYMQTPLEGSSVSRTIGKLLGPALGDQQQGNFSINLWKNAFQDAFQRLCPVRAGCHECGCLPVIARLVMEQCVARLDVAMFNAILRESAHEIPTDPVSDPIVDSTVLPIPAGELSFGSGAQLKNAVGNWSRWLTDMFGMDGNEDQPTQDDFRQNGDGEHKSFPFLNSLSDLLMLPKDMLLDRSVRKEVCPSIDLPLVKRILCNFTPDEFCPDPVPGAVLEALNAETIVERRLSGEQARTFPYTAALVVYTPPSSADVAEKVTEAGGKSPMSRNAPEVQRKGYTSDEELEELNSPLTSIIDKLPLSPTIVADGGVNGNDEHAGYGGATARYELLREVWSG